MQYIRLNYLYRDYSNYKRHNSVVFSNPNLLTIAEIETELRKHLIEDTWFLHSKWNLPDLHFENTDWEQDHPYHEFVGLEVIESQSEESISSIEFFLQKIDPNG